MSDDATPWTLPGELWLPVPGFEGSYDASDFGRARSRTRTLVDINGVRRQWQGRVLTVSYAGPDEYGIVSLGKRRWWRIHVLVLTTFIGACPEGLEGLHRDGDKRNNALSNLEWNTRSANQLDVVRHGRHRWAKRDVCSFGHELAGPNLGERDRQGWRRCLACQRARAEVQRARHRGEALDLRTVADCKYAEIVAGTQPQRRDDTACLYGHPLIAPNLVPSALPALACLACSRAYGHVRRAANRGEPVDHQTVSDAKFAEIAGLSAA